MAFQDPWAARHDRQKVDLAFIVDCTGSMGAYIRQVQKHIRTIAETVARTAFSVRLALVEYRDHPPQDSSFVTKVHDFTISVPEMKTWVNRMSANGGGDGPESVACALVEASKLSYRKDATKVCVLIADAPPHGLGIDHDGFPEGCPSRNDPMMACKTMVENGIVLYCVGCEPAILQYKDFFMGLAFRTGGQYVPLIQAQALSQFIINGTLEEVSLEKLMGYVEDFLHMELAKRRAEKLKTTVDDLASELEKHLNLRSVSCQQLRCNNQVLESATPMAKKIAGKKSLAEVRKLFKGSSPMDYSTIYNQRATTVEVTLTVPASPTRDVSARLIMKQLSRNKVPVTHDESTDELVLVDTIDMLD